MNWPLFLALLAALESGGDHAAIGDGGRAWGKYQLHAGFVAEANRVAGTAYTHADAWCPVRSGEIVVIWHNHHGRRSGTFGDLVLMARQHNGGPRGHEKRATEGYGRKATRWLEGRKQRP